MQVALWIYKCSNGKSVIAFWTSHHWRHWRQWRQKMEQMAIHCRQWRMYPMATMVHPIAIGAIGDHHWRHWRWGMPLAPFSPSPLAPMDIHCRHFLAPMAPLARCPIRYDPFTDKTSEVKCSARRAAMLVARQFFVRRCLARCREAAV